MTTKYKVMWDNGHASGVLTESYANKKAARKAAAAWRREMVAIDPNPKDARQAYSWELITQEEHDNEQAAAAEEQSYEYFNRYIAGDR